MPALQQPEVGGFDGVARSPDLEFKHPMAFLDIHEV
jgi:hypothetical protein